MAGTAQERAASAGACERSGRWDRWSREGRQADPAHDLATASPDRYRPGLAAPLGSLGIRFSALGRPAETLRVTEEAAAMFRELAAVSPDRHRPDLAASPGNPADALLALKLTPHALRPLRFVTDPETTSHPALAHPVMIFGTHPARPPHTATPSRMQPSRDEASPDRIHAGQRPFPQVVAVSGSNQRKLSRRFSDRSRRRVCTTK